MRRHLAGVEQPLLGHGGVVAVGTQHVLSGQVVLAHRAAVGHRAVQDLLLVLGAPRAAAGSSSLRRGGGRRRLRRRGRRRCGAVDVLLLVLEEDHGQAVPQDGGRHEDPGGTDLLLKLEPGIRERTTQEEIESADRY